MLLDGTELWIETVRDKRALMYVLQSTCFKVFSPKQNWIFFLCPFHTSLLTSSREKCRYKVTSRIYANASALFFCSHQSKSKSADTNPTTSTTTTVAFLLSLWVCHAWRPAWCFCPSSLQQSWHSFTLLSSMTCSIAKTACTSLLPWKRDRRQRCPRFSVKKAAPKHKKN